MAAIAWLLIVARDRTTRSLDNPAAQSAWQEFKQAEANRARERSTDVQRRVPKGAEPPALVLMRDHFPAIMGVSLAIGTVFFGFTMLVARGLVRETRRPR